MATIVHELIFARNKAAGNIRVTLHYDSATGAVSQCLVVNTTGAAWPITIGTFVGSIADQANGPLAIGAQAMNLQNLVAQIDFKSG